MLQVPPPEYVGIILQFGGGLATVKSENEIKDRECADGENYVLELDNSHFRPRKPFKKLGAATNAANIMGFAQLVTKSDTISTLIQAGDTVYEWDGGTTFTSRGTVSSGAKLRGPLEANWTMGDKVIITDLTKTEAIKQWDGTTFADVSFTGVSGTVKAKYCFVENERAWFGNMTTTSDTPQVVCASEVSDYTIITTANKPSSSLGEADPFYLVSPDLRPINAMVQAFGKVIFSTQRGSLFNFTGTTSKDYAVTAYYNGSAASGDEAVVHVGNDVYFGREGAIESLTGITNIQEATVDDLSRFIADEAQTIEKWRLVYDRNMQRIYCFPDSFDKIYVFQKALYDDVAKHSAYPMTEFLSPWSVWKTTHSAGFQPTTVWNMLDPATKTMAVYFGDTAGNIYKFDSDTYNGDGATGPLDTTGADVRATRVSKSFNAPPGRMFDVSGWVTYRKPTEAVELNLRFEHGGVSLFDQEINISIPPASATPTTYAGGFYYAGTSYYGTSFEGRLTRQNYTAAGRSSQVQLRVTSVGKQNFSLAEIGLQFTA